MQLQGRGHDPCDLFESVPNMEQVVRMHLARLTMDLVQQSFPGPEFALLRCCFDDTHTYMLDKCLMHVLSCMPHTETQRHRDTHIHLYVQHVVWADKLQHELGNNRRRDVVNY